MTKSSKTGAATDEKPPSLFPDALDATEKGKQRSYPQRNYPGFSLEEALAIAAAIQDQASGGPISRLILADLVGRSPESSAFRGLLVASRLYGLTSGGTQSQTVGLTPRGDAATGPDEDAQLRAKRDAVLSIEPYKQYLEGFNGKKVPGPNVLMEQLKTRCKVPADRAKECMQFLLADARYVGFIRNVQGNEYFDLAGTTPPPASPPTSHDSDEDDIDLGVVTTIERSESLETPRLTVVRPPSDETSPAPAQPKKVFIAHGKDRGPLEEIKKILDQFKVKYAVAVDEPHRGRPISAKVASMMREECSSAIFIFTPDEHMQLIDGNGDTTEVWRPSDNAVYELGAASILYDNRIVIFKDKRVTLASDFSDIGYISFEEGQIAMQMGQLFKELVGLDILEVRAKG